MGRSHWEVFDTGTAVPICRALLQTHVSLREVMGGSQKPGGQHRPSWLEARFEVRVAGCLAPVHMLGLGIPRTSRRCFSSSIKTHGMELRDTPHLWQLP